MSRLFSWSSERLSVFIVLLNIKPYIFLNARSKVCKPQLYFNLSHFPAALDGHVHTRNTLLVFSIFPQRVEQYDIQCVTRGGLSPFVASNIG